jgi:hypothetical protein
MKLQWQGAAALAAASMPFLAPGSAAWPFNGAPAPAEAPGSASAANRAQGVIAAWPERARDLAETIIQEYGAPDDVLPVQLTWTGTGPWKWIGVYRDGSTSGRPRGLEQAVAYDVPVRKWRALGAFARGVDYDPVKRELIAHTDGEPTNFLALNLADDVIRGRRTVAEAREFYDKTASLSLAGKSSPYMTGLRFRPIAADGAAVAGGAGMR